MMIICTNAGSIRNKSMELVATADESERQIVGISETWLTETEQI